MFLCTSSSRSSNRPTVRNLLVAYLSRLGKNSGKVLPQYFPMERLAGKVTGSLHKYNFTCYNCISNITICGRTVEEDYPPKVVTQWFSSAFKIQKIFTYCGH